MGGQGSYREEPPRSDNEQEGFWEEECNTQKVIF
jgi:hypothetical protein